MTNHKQIAILILLLCSLGISAACSAINIQNYFENNEYAEDDKSNYPDTAIHEAENSIDAEITEYIEQIMEKDHLPGTAIALVQGNEVIFAQGYGYRDAEKRLPVTTETLFHIGSTQKSFNAMMIAALVDDGVVEWDTPVVAYYPDFELSSQQSTNTVTFRDLLTMQSGIPDSAEDNFDIDHAISEDVLDYVRDIRLLGAPGEEFSYSNLSASLAGYLAVIAAENDNVDLYNGYEQLLQEQVLDPIGMDSAVFRVSEAQNNPNYGKSYWLEGG